MQPKANDIPFEPICLEDGDDRLNWYLSLDVQFQTGTNPIDHPPPPAPEGVGGVVCSIFGVFCALALLAIMGSCLLQIYQGDPFLIILAAILVTFFVIGLLFPQHWWIVPGGVLWRRTHFYRRRPLDYYFKPEDTPLILHYDGSSALLKNGKLIRLNTPDELARALNLAWISQARRPTEVEIASFFGNKTGPKTGCSKV